MEVSPKFSAQTKARKAALDILFQADMRSRSFAEVLVEQRELSDEPFRKLTIQIVEGVAAHQHAIDKRVNSCAQGWTLQRMPLVDRNLARMAIYEMDYTDTPPAVVIAETIELASWLSTDSSPNFLNGLLAKASESK